MSLVVKKATNRFDYARCVQIRTIVFTIGQNVPADREIDIEEDEATHFLARADGVAMGAGRWRKYKESSAKIERLAVLDAGRGQGIGKTLMQAMLSDIRANENITQIILCSQDHAIPFYQALGFSVDGEGYMDGGDISHHDMMLKLGGAA